MICLAQMFGSWCQIGNFELQPTLEIPCSYYMGKIFLREEDFEVPTAESSRRFVFELLDRGSKFAIYSFKGFI